MTRRPKRQKGLRIVLGEGIVVGLSWGPIWLTSNEDNTKRLFRWADVRGRRVRLIAEVLSERRGVR